MKLFSLLLTLFITASANAAYIVHSVAGNVNLIQKGKTIPLKKGMKVGPSDIIDIPTKGQLEIYNELDSKIYTSVKEGKLSVIRLMLDAKNVAADNGGAVSRQVNVAKGNSGDDGRVYIQQGMVKRSKSVFDDLSENVDVDPKTLARYVASVVYTGNLDAGVQLPVEVEHNSGDNGILYKVTNNVDFPVYFNVLKITGEPTPVIEISEIGQPSGCYVVYPEQSLSREQLTPARSDTKHVLIMSHCKFDIGEVVDMIGDLLSTEGVGTLSGKDAPVEMLLL